MAPSDMAQLTASPPHIIEYWTVQNTGWSGGSSWFDVTGGGRTPVRFESDEAARTYVCNKARDAGMKWRVTHVVMVCTDRKRVTTEEWTEL